MQKSLNFFGTDGIRGKYGDGIINEKFAYNLGLAFAHFLEKKNYGKSKPILLAQDTRLSGNKLLTSFGDGLEKREFIVKNLGVLPTPALAFTVINQRALAGIMITASHNHHEDNGFKIFSGDGRKLSIDDEHSIESFISDNQYSLRKIKRPLTDVNDHIKAYLSNFSKFFENDFLAGKKIVIDLANGATNEITPLCLKSFGAEVISINQGEGLINDQAGSEFTNGLCEKVLQEKADLGFAHDGDGDRVVFVDRNGKKIHGDKVLGLLALNNKKLSLVNENGFVATHHSNSGLEHTLKQNDINFYRSDIGDRNVFTLMKEKRISWGGESSGHVICSDYMNTGDGLFTALSVLKCVKELQMDLVEMADQIVLWPSKSISIKVAIKRDIASFVNLQSYLNRSKKSHKNLVRILIRYSGTEPKIRLLVEAKSDALMEKVFNDVKYIIEKEI